MWVNSTERRVTIYSRNNRREKTTQEPSSLQLINLVIKTNKEQDSQLHADQLILFTPYKKWNVIYQFRYRTMSI